MTQKAWLVLGAISVAALIGLVVLWLRMPVFRWYCRRCRKIVATGRFHPRKCGCGTSALVAYFCNDCGSWNTAATAKWHCAACSSTNISLGVEYSFGTGLWRTRNRNEHHSWL